MRWIKCNVTFVPAPEAFSKGSYTTQTRQFGYQKVICSFILSVLLGLSQLSSKKTIDEFSMFVSFPTDPLENFGLISSSKTPRLVRYVKKQKDTKSK